MYENWVSQCSILSQLWVCLLLNYDVVDVRNSFNRTKGTTTQGEIVIGGVPLVHVKLHINKGLCVKL